MTCSTCGHRLDPADRVHLAGMWVWLDHCGTRGCPLPRYTTGEQHR